MEQNRIENKLEQKTYNNRKNKIKLQIGWKLEQ